MFDRNPPPSLPENLTIISVGMLIGRRAILIHAIRSRCSSRLCSRSIAASTSVEPALHRKINVIAQCRHCIDRGYDIRGKVTDALSVRQ
jgi:hypothetical protein